MVLDTNVVLDLLVFDDPLVPPIRQLLAQGQLRWITDEAQRIELGRVLSYSKVAPRVAFYEKTAEGVLAAFDAAVQCVPTAPKVRFTCTDPDDQHFLDLAAQHRALLISKDKAVLKQRKRLSTWLRRDRLAICWCWTRQAPKTPEKRAVSAEIQWFSDGLYPENKQ